MLDRRIDHVLDWERRKYTPAWRFEQSYLDSYSFDVQAVAQSANNRKHTKGAERIDTMGRNVLAACLEVGFTSLCKCTI